MEDSVAGMIMCCRRTVLRVKCMPLNKAPVVLVDQDHLVLLNNTVTTTYTPLMPTNHTKVTYPQLKTQKTE